MVRQWPSKISFGWVNSAQKWLGLREFIVRITIHCPLIMTQQNYFLLVEGFLNYLASVDSLVACIPIIFQLFLQFTNNGPIICATWVHCNFQLKGLGFYQWKKLFGDCNWFENREQSYSQLNCTHNNLSLYHFFLILLKVFS